MIHLTPMTKFMYNTHNNNHLIIHPLSSSFQKHPITGDQCDKDTDTSIVRAAFAAQGRQMGGALGAVAPPSENSENSREKSKPFLVFRAV